MAVNPTSAPRYCDYYGMLSYADFLARVAEGTLAQHDISERTEAGALL
jgi:hypothetical protein